MAPLQIKLQPKQSQVWRKWEHERHTRNGMGGARGGAKSGGGRRLILLRRMHYPRTTGLILRRTYPELYQSHVVKLFDEYPELTQYWRQESKELYFPENGSRLFFGSAQHPRDMANFYSAEYADILVDEAQEFHQSELERLSGSNRCTTNQTITPGMLFTFMPGLSESGAPPVGLDYLKRVFVDGVIRGDEAEQTWTFTQAFAWDNVEWARSELDKDGISVEEFYTWPEPKRREYFIERTVFAKTLLAITNKELRRAWLDGSWDVFTGQYFPQFKWDEHTNEHEQCLAELRPWHTLWISGDWGFDHPACYHWHAEDENGLVTTFDEYWTRETGETQQGQEIAARTERIIANLGKEFGKVKIAAFPFSWDAFGKLSKDTRKPITQLIGEPLKASRVPQPFPADASPGSRISGWRLMSKLLDAKLWRISRKCEKLIATIPLLLRDMERNSEDVRKVDWSEESLGDDAADCARYGLSYMAANAAIPWDVRMARKVAEIRKALPDPTVAAIHIQKQMTAELDKRKNAGKVNNRSANVGRYGRFR